MRREKRGILASIIVQASRDLRRVSAVAARCDGGSRAAHQLLVIVQVMQRVQTRAEYLVRALQVMQIRAREIAAGVTLAGGIDRAQVIAIARIAQLDD